MRRRGVTVLLGAIVVAVLLGGVIAAPVPYVVLSAGPTVNTLGSQDGKEVIRVSGRPTSKSEGQLRLTTVSVRPETDLLSAIWAWFDDEEAVVPRELIYPPDQTEEQVEQRNEEDFKESQTSAETAALSELGYPVQVTVTKVVPGGPSEGKLRTGDVLTSVGGRPIGTAGELTDLIRGRPAGTALTIGYNRAGVPGTASVTSRAAKDGDPPRIGVEIDQKQPHPFTLKIELDEIGGPSAGLMFALGIVDKVRPDDLTGGKIIAGTGTIDDRGRVGPIGGIPQKLVGARAAGAEYFLTPADNCAEAADNPVEGLTLAKVATLSDALDALAAVRQGRRPKGC
ncbi:MAG TPA: PDZ domain-containing protein [Micromonosporaceae bacterium]|nr:PDZ domain-containing protein [Micromonosporaceae bacterium]